MRRPPVAAIAVLAGLAVLLCGCSGASVTETGVDDIEGAASGSGGSYTIVDTNQTVFYNNTSEIAEPSEGQPFYGQDARYEGNRPAYRDNNDGTVSDLNTGLIWQQDPGEKMTYAEAVAGADDFTLAGYEDWRLPTIKELYSLIEFSGLDPRPEDPSGQVPFIDTDYFNFSYGDTSEGERIIDSQWVTSTEYVNTTMDGNPTVFGVNFADGRIKGYPTEKEFYCIYVRGNTSYGENDFTDNNDGTVTDRATGLTWSKDDSAEGLNWEEALAWVEQKNSENYLGYSDWRLPNAKELQSIVDYSRSPDTTSSAAIDPLFNCTSITNEAGQTDYPFYWSSTTHASAQGGNAAAYVAFGRALGYMNNQWMDVHGAGCQRSDPKEGDPADYPEVRGPQGDAVRIYNYVRLVRGSGSSPGPDPDPDDDPTSRTCAHDSIGVMDPGTTWYLAEGATIGGFETWVLVANPTDQTADVSLTYQTDTGEVTGPSFQLAPGTRESINVADTVQTYEVSTEVNSSSPVITERAVYYGS